MAGGSGLTCESMLLVKALTTLSAWTENGTGNLPPLSVCSLASSRKEHAAGLRICTSPPSMPTSMHGVDDAEEEVDGQSMPTAQFSARPDPAAARLCHGEQIVGSMAAQK